MVGFGGAAISGPQWSPDGKWVSYTKADRDLLPHVYVIPAGRRQGAAHHRRGQLQRHRRPLDAGRQAHRLPVRHWTWATSVRPAGPRPRSTVVALTPEEKDAGRTGRRQRGGSGPRGRSPSGRRDGGRRLPDGPATSRGEDRLRPTSAAVPGRSHAAATPSARLAVSPDGRTVVFTTTGARAAGRCSRSGRWRIDGDGLTPRHPGRPGQPTRRATPPARGRVGGGMASLQFAKDGRTLYYRQGGGIYAVAVGGAPASGGTPPHRRRPAAGVVAAAGAAPARRLRRHRQAAAGDAARSTSPSRSRSTTRRAQAGLRRELARHEAPLLRPDDARRRLGQDARHATSRCWQYVGDQEELHDVVNMMIGELNASHTGISGGGGGAAGARRRPDALPRLRAGAGRERLLQGDARLQATARPTRTTSRSTSATSSSPSTART